MRPMTMAAAGTSSTVEKITADCRSDWLYAGGAGETSDPLHSLRSGNPGQNTSASPARRLQPGAIITALSVAYRYNSGYSAPAVGTTLGISIVGKQIYTSPPLVGYRYDLNRSNYSAPVHVDVTGLSIAVPSDTDARVAIEFRNNGRNVQLLLPMVINVSCAIGPCLEPALWEPPERHVVFSAGELVNGTACPSFRIPALAAVGSKRLLAFVEARFHGYRPDVHPLTAIAYRHSLDGLVGARWSPIQVLARTRGGKGTNYPTPVYDAVTGIVHLYYSDYGKGTGYTYSTDGGLTWAPLSWASGVLANGVGMNSLQLSDGRLVVPCTVNRTRATCFSDDHAKTWRAGAAVALAPSLRAALVADRGKTSSLDDGSHDDVTGGLDGCGETSIARDGRGPRTLALFCRLGSSALVNHAVATSDDGGETWSLAQPLPSIVGPTCQGSVGPLAAANGSVLVSAPSSRDGSLNGRENLGLWTVDLTTGRAYVAEHKGRLWGCKGAYSAFSQDGTMNLFEAGENFRYASIVLAQRLGGVA